MAEYSKHLYRIGEVAALLGLPISTIKYWTDTFDEIQPVAVGTGRQKRYRAEDIETVKLVRHLMHDRQMQIEGAKAQLKRARLPYRGFKCESSACAEELLRQIAESANDNPRIQAMAQAVSMWLCAYAGAKQS